MGRSDVPLTSLRIADVVTFLAVRQVGTITRAARELKVTPSQVSKAVARLELHLGATLLTRGSKGVQVSDTGLRLGPRLEELVQGLSHLRAPDLARPELTVAAPSYLNQLFLPTIARAAPDLRMRGLELPPAQIRAYVGENFFDLALTLGNEQFPAPWVTDAVGEVRKGLFASRAVADALGPAPIAAERLRAVPFLSPIYTANGQFVAIDDGCPLRRSERVLGHEAQTMALALELASMTDQVVFGPALAARRLVESGRLVELVVEGWDVRETLCAAFNGERVKARARGAILTALRAAAAG